MAVHKLISLYGRCTIALFPGLPIVQFLISYIDVFSGKAGMEMRLSVWAATDRNPVSMEEL